MKNLFFFSFLFSLPMGQLFGAAEGSKKLELRKAYLGIRNQRSPENFRFSHDGTSHYPTIKEGYDQRGADASGSLALLWYLKNPLILAKFPCETKDESETLPREAEKQRAWAKQLVTFTSHACSRGFLPAYADELSLWLDIGVMLENVKFLIHPLKNIKTIMNFGRIDPYYARTLLSDKILPYISEQQNLQVKPRKKRNIVAKIKRGLLSRKQKQVQPILAEDIEETSPLTLEDAYGQAMQYLDELAPLGVFN